MRREYILGDVASLASGSTATNFTVYNGLKLGGLVGAGDGNIVVLDGTTKQFQIGSVGIGIASDAIYGNGSGLTNLAQATNALRVTPVESYNYRTVDMTVQTNVYDDIVFEASAVNPVGIVDAATLVDTSGQSADQLALVFAANRLMLVAAQMPHTWNEGTTVYPHLHFEVQIANAVTNVWKIDYSIADIDGTFPASTHVTNQITFAAGSQWKHFLMNVPTNGISMTGKHKSAIIRLRYTLLSTTESMHLVSFDVHYRYSGDTRHLQSMTCEPSELMALAKCMTCIPDADSALIYGLCQQANGTYQPKTTLQLTKGITSSLKTETKLF